MLFELFEILFQNSQGKANRLAHRKLFTAGYGNQPEPDFLARLRSFDVNFILDVRRREARSWNPRYRPGYFHIGEFLKSAKFSYWFLVQYDGNSQDFGNRFNTLAEYSNWMLNEPKVMRSLHNISAFLEGDTGIVPCVLCAERSYQNCHRTIVAQELLKYINAIAHSEGTIPWILQHI